MFRILCGKHIRTAWLLLHKESPEVPKDLVKVRYEPAQAGCSSCWPLPSPCHEQVPALARSYLGDGWERRQPGPVAGRAWAADGSAQVAAVGVAAAQHLQSAGDGVATPVRDPCKEEHRETKLHKCQSVSQTPGLGTQKPEPKDNTDWPVHRLVRAEHSLSL